MTDLKDLPAHLQILSASDWQKLFDLLPVMEMTKEFGTMPRMKKNEKGVFIFPSMEWAPVTTEFFKVVHELGIVPVFDWVDWEEGRLMLDNKDQDFSASDIITLCKLFTVMIRADRFMDGYLVGQLKRKNVLTLFGVTLRKVERQHKTPKRLVHISIITKR